MQIKKIGAFILSLFMILSLAACGSNQAEKKPSDSEKSKTEISQSTDDQKNEDDQDAEAVTQEEADENTENASGGNKAGGKSDDILILYFSANNTKDTDAVSAATPIIDGASSVEWIAREIQENVGGDLVPIIPSEDYPLEYDALADYAKQEADQDVRPAFEDLGVDPTSYKTVFIGYPIWWYQMPMIMDTFFDTYDFSGVTIIPFNTHEGSSDGGTYSDISELESNATVLDGFAIRGGEAGNEDAKNAVSSWIGGLDLE